MNRIEGFSCVLCGFSFFGDASGIEACPRCGQEVSDFDFFQDRGDPFLQFDEGEGDSQGTAYDPLVFRIQGLDLDEDAPEEEEVRRESWLKRVTRGMFSIFT